MFELEITSSGNCWGWCACTCPNAGGKNQWWSIGINTVWAIHQLLQLDGISSQWVGLTLASDFSAFNNESLSLWIHNNKVRRIGFFYDPNSSETNAENLISFIGSRVLTIFPKVNEVIISTTRSKDVEMQRKSMQAVFESILKRISSLFLNIKIYWWCNTFGYDEMLFEWEKDRDFLRKFFNNRFVVQESNSWLRTRVTDDFIEIEINYPRNRWTWEVDVEEIIRSLKLQKNWHVHFSGNKVNIFHNPDTTNTNWVWISYSEYLKILEVARIIWYNQALIQHFQGLNTL